MILKFKNVALVLSALVAQAAIACPGGAIQLNDVAVLRGDRVVLKEGDYSPIEMFHYNGGRFVDANRVVHTPAREFDVIDSKGQTTHYVQIVAVKGDSQRPGRTGFSYISTTYKIWDAQKRDKGTWAVHTNYHGGGVVTRGLPNPNAAATIDTSGVINSVGCNSIDASRL